MYSGLLIIYNSEVDLEAGGAGGGEWLGGGVLLLGNGAAFYGHLH